VHGGNDQSFAAGNGDANENVAATATPEDPAMRGDISRGRIQPSLTTEE